MGYRIKTEDGTLRVTHNLYVGGKIVCRVVKGKGADLGIFESAVALNNYCPNPVVGQWAQVQTSDGGVIYICKADGQWTATDIPITNDATLVDRITEVLDNTVYSFNGRNGVVVPQAGDYTAGMVGAAPKAGDALQDFSVGFLSVGGGAGITGDVDVTGDVEIHEGHLQTPQLKSNLSDLGSATASVLNLKNADADAATYLQKVNNEAVRLVNLAKEGRRRWSSVLARTPCWPRRRRCRRWPPTSRRPRRTSWPWRSVWTSWTAM